MATVALHTLGCKLNHAETSTIGKQFLDRGYQLVDFGTPADVCVINTCSVTFRADRECRQIIRRALRTSPSPFVIVTGCYAQLQPEEVASLDGVDLVLGTREKFEIFSHADPTTKRGTPLVAVSSVADCNDFGPASSAIPGEQTRAYLKVQDGCDYNCSFCTIPLARGASRSLPVDECLRQTRDLVSRGYREVVLTGVNVGDYGKKENNSLLALLRALVRVEGLERIRISSIEPNLLSDDVLRFAADEPKMARHFHIPLQSGDDRILRLMRRRYISADYAALVERVRTLFPDAGIGVDVIIGFPGEDETHFETTHDFLSQLPVSYLHVFTYSERPDTPAAQFAGPVEPRVRFSRSEAMRALGVMKKRAFWQSQMGTRHEILTEEEKASDLRLGFTENYIRVAVSGPDVRANTFLPVELVNADGEYCIGHVVGVAR
jgi:threonylcarbamoyladenosine tRNA methylthiotransferase MtaB